MRASLGVVDAVFLDTFHPGDCVGKTDSLINPLTKRGEDDQSSLSWRYMTRNDMPDARDGRQPKVPGPRDDTSDDPDEWAVVAREVTVVSTR